MTAIRLTARIAIVAVASALLTIWMGWASLPLLGLVYGFVDRRAFAQGSIAAIGAMAGWLAILGAIAARGGDVRAVAERIGALFQVPGWVFVSLALAFAAMLCGTAAVAGVALGMAYDDRIAPRPAKIEHTT